LELLAGRHARGEKTPARASRECKKCEFRLVSANERALGKAGFDECWSGLIPPQADAPLSLDVWNLHFTAADKFLANGSYLMSQLTETDIEPPKKASARELYQDGWEDFERRRIQIRKINSGDPNPEVKRDELRGVIASWRFPLHFIDFETTRVALPFHRGMRPYEQVAFQFSHHVVHQNGKVEHRGDWINSQRGVFPNFEFLRQLRRELSTDDGTIFRYATHENTVLNDIIRQLEVSDEPDRAELIAWAKTITYRKDGGRYAWRGEREMVDLLDVVKRYYYHPRMGSSNSIKAVLPAILHQSAFLRRKYAQPIYGAPGGISSRNFTHFSWDHIWVRAGADGKVTDPYAILKSLCGSLGGHDYDTLERLYSEEEVADGGAAMTAYAMMQFTQMGEPERRQLTSALLRYCELDTLAMVMLYEHWCELVELPGRLQAAA
jgi:hypothetical protein